MGNSVKKWQACWFFERCNITIFGRGIYLSEVRSAGLEFWKGNIRYFFGTLGFNFGFNIIQFFSCRSCLSISSGVLVAKVCTFAALDFFMVFLPRLLFVVSINLPAFFGIVLLLKITRKQLALSSGGYAFLDKVFCRLFSYGDARSKLRVIVGSRHCTLRLGLVTFPDRRRNRTEVAWVVAFHVFSCAYRATCALPIAWVLTCNG